MVRGIRILLFVALMTPYGVFAATFAGDENVTLSTTPVDNAYLVGSSVTVTTPLPADLSAVGPSIGVYAPVTGDILAVGGMVTLLQQVAGDVRIFAGKILIHGPITGDIVLGGGTVTISSTAKDMYVAGGNVEVTGGATGPVVIYGGNILLSGQYAGDVEVVASNTFTIGENTRIEGSLRYNAPTQVTIPESSTVAGTTTYTGAYSYIPTDEEARTFAVAGTGIFFLVRVVSSMIVAALFVGLFRRFTERINTFISGADLRKKILYALLGFAIAISAPILVLLLLISFVGIGVAFIISVLYMGLILVAHVYAGIGIGYLLRKKLLYRIRGRKVLTWQDAVLGTGVLYLLGLVPFLGSTLWTLLMAVFIGAIAIVSYKFAFAKEVVA